MLRRKSQAILFLRAGIIGASLATLFALWFWGCFHLNFAVFPAGVLTAAVIVFIIGALTLGSLFGWSIGIILRQRYSHLKIFQPKQTEQDKICMAQASDTADLPASDTLTHASSEPLQSHQAILLWVPMETTSAQVELLRASAEGRE